MLADTKLDITGLSWPASLLEFSRFLDEAENGADIEVLVKDPDILGTIRMIISNSSDRIMNIEREAGRFRVRIKKADRKCRGFAEGGR